MGGIIITAYEDYYHILSFNSYNNPVKWTLLFQFMGGRFDLGVIKELALGHTRNTQNRNQVYLMLKLLVAPTMLEINFI